MIFLNKVEKTDLTLGETLHLIERFLEQFPSVKITLKKVCVENIAAMGGTNNVAVEWDIVVTNKDGREVQNSGVTTIVAKKGKVVFVKDYYFDIERFNIAWGEGEDEG